MVRKLDELGRIVIPVEFRKKNNWDIGQEIEIIEDVETIILKKYKGKICSKCKKTVSNIDKFCSNCGCKLK